MSETRGQTYVELYWKLDTKNDENDVYKMAKLQEKKDFNQIKYIKDDVDRFFMKDDELRINWENTSISCSTKRVRKSRSSWTIHFMTRTGDLFGEFKSPR
jgi:hypothetical protein